MKPLVVFMLGGAVGIFGRKHLNNAYRKTLKVAANVQLTAARAAARAREDYQDAVAEVHADIVEDERADAAKGGVRKEPVAS